MQGCRRGETILNDIRREELSLKTNKKMKNETVDLRSQRDYTSQQVVFEVFFFQSITAMQMGQNQIIFSNFYTRAIFRTAV